MCVNDIRKIAEDENFEVFNIIKQEDGTYRVVKCTPEQYMFWHEQEGLFRTYADTELMCTAVSKTNSYPVMLNKMKLSDKDAFAISKRFTVYREASKENKKSVFEKFSTETKKWEYAFTLNDIFEYVKFIKDVNANPDALVAQYIQNSEDSLF